MAEIYKIFSKDFSELVYDDNALEEMFLYESRGIRINNPRNGYLAGKQWMDVNIAMWKEDIHTSLLTKEELYLDETFPHWWLDKVLT